VLHRMVILPWGPITAKTTPISTAGIAFRIFLVGNVHYKFGTQVDHRLIRFHDIAACSIQHLDHAHLTVQL